MFTYPLTLADAIQAFVKFKANIVSEVKFDDPVLNQLYADEAQGLCTITIQQPDVDIISIRNVQDSVLEISYLDPELEFVRKLQC
jgi:hypothetical protein